MSRDNVVYTVCGLLLGLIIGSFLIGPKLARSKLAGPDQIQSSSAVAPAASEPAAAAAPPAGSPMEQVRQRLDTLKKQVEQNPNDFDSLVQLGNMYMDVSKFPQAIDYFNRALAVREEPSVRTDLGICYKQSGQNEQARDAFRKVATQQPDEWQAIYNLAIVDGEMKDYADARVQLTKLKQMRPGDPQVTKLEQALAAVK